MPLSKIQRCLEANIQWFHWEVTYILWSNIWSEADSEIPGQNVSID